MPKIQNLNLNYIRINDFSKTFYIVLSNVWTYLQWHQ